MTSPAGYFGTRLTHDRRRAVLWECLYRWYFKRLIRPGDCVLELGCGRGEFINAVEAQRRIAVDAWEEFPSHLDPGIESRIGDVTDLSFLADDSVDVAFASNLVEHLTHASCATMLAQLRQKLRHRGKLILVQPNYRFAYREYFDDYTHLTVYSHVSLCDFLSAHGFSVVRCLPRFLPLTLKSRVPVSPLWIWAYLRSPVKIGGKQMLVIAEVAAGR
jgi:SAM-dependent methyltransferase